MRAMIGTWRMSLGGVARGLGLLEAGADCLDAVTEAVAFVEDDPAFTSVGFGGLPDREGCVTADAALMDGGTLRLGGVMSAQNIRNPIRAARRLLERAENCLLAGEGAQRFAREAGLEMRDLRTPQALARWREALAQRDAARQPYRGHDTVCVLALDEAGRMAAGTSTSGLFLKEPGRVGDSPLVGSGFYCDARYGAAAATGLGEEIMRGCLSYEVVSLMRRGAGPHDACVRALRGLQARLKRQGETMRDVSLIALTPAGVFGAATSLRVFPFAAGKDGAAEVYLAGSDGQTRRASPGEADAQP